MAIASHPYVSFPENNCREAFEFYGQIFGAEPEFLTMGQIMTGFEDGSENLIAHAELRSGDITLLGSDNVSGEPGVMGNAHSVVLMGSAADEERGRELFEKLMDGGTVAMPMEKQEWGGVYGDGVDRFGVQWGLNFG